VRTSEGTGTLRATGDAELIFDPETKTELSRVIPWFESYWKSAADPEFSLIRVNLKLIRYDNPTDRRKYTIRLN
ncbi:MAG: hypothetical protein ACFE7R_07895, partial [Candidatus Hodarchaeota archaeon]